MVLGSILQPVDHGTGKYVCLKLHTAYGSARVLPACTVAAAGHGYVQC